MGYWRDCREFFQQFRQQYTTTGSVLPSSRALARALTKPLRQAKGPRRVLEVGPGTGAVTREIVRCLRPEDTFDIVEINDRFVAVLERRFAEEPEFQRCRAQARVIHAPLQDVPGAGEYDFMVSGLPLNNFGLGLVDDIFRSYERLLKPDGTLSYFEYVWIRALKTPFVAAGEKARLTALSRILEEKVRRHQVGEDVVLMNVPPAVARHFCFGKRTVQAPG
jgi:phospholipid N-methyltransferase